MKTCANCTQTAEYDYVGTLYCNTHVPRFLRNKDGSVNAAKVVQESIPIEVVVIRKNTTPLPTPTHTPEWPEPDAVLDPPFIEVPEVEEPAVAETPKTTPKPTPKKAKPTPKAPAPKAE